MPVAPPFPVQPTPQMHSSPSIVRSHLVTCCCLLTAALCVTLSGCKIEKVDTTAEGGATSESTSAEGAVKTASGESVKVAFVTNGVDPFWTIAEAGCQAAADELGVECVIREPIDGPADQKRMLEELIADNIDGVAVSPINPENQTGILNQVAEATNLITHDSDAPKTNRLAYIGMNNYDAGRMCGKLVKETIPDGGEVIIFVGRLGQLNADQRRQGVIDELLDRSHDPQRAYDSADEVLKGDKYTILDTRTDNFDYALAKSRAEDAIVKYPNIACMVGLFAYNAPNVLEAIRASGQVGKIKVVSFDEDDRTLAAIVDGSCSGTVVQDPYQYGYQSVQMLTKLAAGDKSAIPDGKYIDIPARVIRKDSVDEFWETKKRLLGQSDESDAAAE